MNFFNRILHYYIYDMRLKKKLVVSHTILFLIPTAVLICFLFLNIFRIVMDDTIRSEQALSSQSVLSVKRIRLLILLLDGISPWAWALEISNISRIT